jgi:undecaprenyl-diphosphatase
MDLLGAVLSSDDRLMVRLLAWRPPRWLRACTLALTRLSDGGIWLLAVLTLVASGDKGLNVLAAGAVAATLANLLLVLVKGRVARRRPCERTRPRGFDVEPPIWFPSDRFSFPSGHALNAFTAGSLVALSFPVLAIPVLALAVSMAASRVVLGLHWLSDVLVSALAGTLIGAAAWLVLLS